MTVTGEVDADLLGITLPHEHLLIDLHRVFQPHREMILNDVALAVPELSMFFNAGGRTLVEVTTPDLSRDPVGLLEISEATGVQIVMGTGRYREPFYEESIWRKSTQQLAEELHDEVVNGVDGGIRPGVLGEIGVHHAHVSPVEERIHRAIARVHLESGLAITTHSNATAVGLDQLAIFEEEGVDPRFVAIGHADTYMVEEYHRSVLERGAWLQFDTIRGTHDFQTQRVAETIVRYRGDGHLGQLLLSQDICVDRHLTVYGEGGYAYLITEFRERLEDVGLSDDDLSILFEVNPKRLLTCQGPWSPV